MPPLSVTTNILRHHPKLHLGASNKAAPTVQVSFSNANAQCSLSPSPATSPSSSPLPPVQSSCIPFPSQPIQCSRISPSHDVDPSQDPAFAVFENWLVGHPPSSVPEEDNNNNAIWCSSLVGAPQRIPSSFVHRDVHHSLSYSPDSDPFITTTNDANAGSGFIPYPAPGPRKRKMAVRRVKVPHYAAKSTKRTKRSKSANKKTNVGDVQFMATLHRSILAHLRDARFAASVRSTQCASDSAEFDSSEDSLDDDSRADSSLLVLRVQDEILVERLWRSLVDHGCSPSPGVPFSSRTDDADMFRLRRERVDHVFQTEPTISLGLPGECSMDVDPATSNLERAPTRSPTAVARVGGGSEVLTLSQLVATLILHHRDRSSTRRRSQTYNRDQQHLGRSPLSNVVRFHANRGRK
ncbi:hypothetical protein BDY19DRAFT_384686 [Irpex rosettiformis]|uniref:Uncharacterized protein n=1 Tax=Irpex rosettiformis TaxID=378272 RepID=A0ACB8TV30_9APHY|nr:hypothetical protein BDY19DRAFT_384686 [Irpex rosettiformis]